MRTTRPRLIATLLASASLIGSTWATAAVAAPKACSGAKTCSTADTTPPKVTVSAPSPGAVIRGTVTVAGTASDNVAVSRVDVSVDGGSATTAGGTSSWSLALNTVNYPDGAHTITATARDTSGNVSSSSVSVTVDNVPDASPSPTPSPTPTTPPADTTAPSVAIAAPTAAATISGTASVTGTASDNVALDRVEVLVDGGASRIATGTSNWSSSVDTTTLANGSHTITSRAFDTAGNTSSASVTVSVQNATPTSGGSGTTAPNTQGVWVSPEGATIDVNTAGAWTISQIYSLLRDNSAAPGDFARIAPTLTVKVQDTYGSQVVTSVNGSPGSYSNYSAVLYLKGVNSSFSTQPDAQLAHEYGHVWTLYHLYISRQGDWSPYLGFRWSAADGSTTLAQDSRLDSAYQWSRSEIIAEDYRLLLGSATNVSQRPTQMNTDIAPAGSVTGLRSFLLQTWAGGA